MILFLRVVRHLAARVMGFAFAGFLVCSIQGAIVGMATASFLNAIYWCLRIGTSVFVNTPFASDLGLREMVLSVVMALSLGLLVGGAAGSVCGALSFGAAGVIGSLARDGGKLLEKIVAATKENAWRNIAFVIAICTATSLFFYPFMARFWGRGFSWSAYEIVIALCGGLLIGVFLGLLAHNFYFAVRTAINHNAAQGRVLDES